MPPSLAQRRALLIAALGFTRLRWREPASPVAAALSRWMNSWTGVGAVVIGMTRQGHRLHLTNIDGGAWWATFSRAAGLAHDGFGAAATPWTAVQHAAWDPLAKAETDAP